MSNITASEAGNIHGQNPQYLIEKILRLKIYDCDYWKEQCFGLSALTLIDRAVLLDHVGGAYSGIFRPTDFICLILKMLQIGPDMDIIREFIHNTEHKYITALGMFYLRLVGTAKEVFTELEPFYNDYRKLRLITPDGWTIIHMDEFVEMMLEKEMVLNIALPHLDKRYMLEDRGQLSPRKSVLEGELDEMITELEKEENVTPSQKRDGDNMTESDDKRVKTDVAVNSENGRHSRSNSSENGSKQSYRFLFKRNNRLFSR